MYPSFLLEILAFRMLNRRLNFFVSWQTVGFRASAGGNFKITIFEYIFSSLYHA
jgi:hypothetical protein